MKSRRELLRSLVGRNQECPLPPLTAFEKELERWVSQRCSFRDHSCASVSALHDDYVEWCDEARDIPCSDLQFAQWLRLQALDVNEYGFVYGLVLNKYLYASGVKVQ